MVDVTTQTEEGNQENEMTADKINYYDASPNPDHFTKEQIERITAGLDEAEDVCRECGNTPETGACYFCKMD